MSTILNPIYFAVSWVIVTLHDALGFIVGKSAHESLKWSLAIIGLVVLIRIILIPLFVKQIKSQRALTALQPKMKEIQKRYKDDRQKQSEEMMKLYKEHKTNPLSSCLPIIAQAPIFFSLFTVLNGIAHNHPHGVFKGSNGLGTAAFLSAQKARFFGASLSDSFLNTHVSSTKVVTVALILFMSATTFTTQRQLMVKGMPKTSGSNDMMAQQQKIMLYVFPVIFAVSGVNFPVGVLIYWGTTNLWTFGQQYYVIKRNPTPGSPAYIELMEKRAKKGLTDGAAPTESTGTTQTLNPDNGSTGAQNQQSPQRKQPKKRKPKK